MAEKEIDDIKKLPPQERLKRLKELEDKRKRQEEEAKRLVEDSLKEIKLDEMLKEIDVPKQKDVDVNRLLEQSGNIEEQVKKEKINVTASGGADYGRRISELLPQNTLQEIQQWYSSGNAPPTREEFLEVYENAREAYEMVGRTMQKAPNEELYSAPSEQLVGEVVSSMRVLRSLGYKNKWFRQDH
jgi:hypothetical protein